MEKYCQFCGSQVTEDAVICLSCGKQIKELKKTEPEINDNSVELGIVALVGGLFFPPLAWILGGLVELEIAVLVGGLFFPPLAWILGGFGLNNAIKTNNGTGKALNIVGIIAGVIMFFVTVVLIYTEVIFDL
ncbi:MAG: hypothetical protein ACOX8T_11680 [Bacillota bacterium]|jgi:hypothetical protein